VSLVSVDPAEALERAADPGEFVVQCLERGKTWLAEALEHGDLDALVNTKGYAATLRVAVMQKQLGKDAELSATELVRRAERCIGLGIRQGQAEGSVAKPGAIGAPPPNRSTGQVHGGRRDNTTSIRLVTEFAPFSELSGNQAGIYAMTDDVTDEQFEQAIEEAKNEGNLSRANVVRKAKGKPKPTPKDRHEIHHKKRRIDAERIIEESIAILEGLAMGLGQIEDVKSLDAEKRLVWLDAIAEPLAAINHFRKELRG
jgi:hypothetical protein